MRSAARKSAETFGIPLPIRTGVCTRDVLESPFVVVVGAGDCSTWNKLVGEQGDCGWSPLPIGTAECTFGRRNRGIGGWKGRQLFHVEHFGWVERGVVWLLWGGGAIVPRGTIGMAFVGYGAPGRGALPLRTGRCTFWDFWKGGGQIALARSVASCWAIIALHRGVGWWSEKVKEVSDWSRIWL